MCDLGTSARLYLVTGNPLEKPPMNNTGFHPIHDMPDFNNFTALLRANPAPIRQILLRQSVCVGLRNIHGLANEMLFQSRIHSETHIELITDDELWLLHQKMAEVVQMAVTPEVGTEQGAMQKLQEGDTWAVQYRKYWNKADGTDFYHSHGPPRKGGKRMPNGNLIVFEYKSKIVDLQKVGKDPPPASKEIDDDVKEEVRIHRATDYSEGM
ncbi:hypothetical protein BDK51DRAFT_31691 [Blyttiomyces helicus]|uniref:Formamidopyrimidine-DNA glycosylase H2TH DNA-binding domain-containing protein n=1 Tax=Blyttiomyces helicus TaxID=388810 RepID=A0A4P9WIP1_9FUNG|nr:hypothetical protein BDK51DRAFT_31691 [Blyttiomyces helicus]|eukprot:RKO91308.1 hypothetical protein BDK51DRAFT_31691 [Blyttiomyces helicus]